MPRSAILALGAFSACPAKDFSCDEDSAFLQGRVFPQLLTPEKSTSEPAILPKSLANSNQPEVLFKNVQFLAQQEHSGEVVELLEEIKTSLGVIEDEMFNATVRAQLTIGDQLVEIHACRTSSDYNSREVLDGEIDALHTSLDEEKQACDGLTDYANGLQFPDIPRSGTWSERDARYQALKIWIDGEPGEQSKWQRFEEHHNLCKEKKEIADDIRANYKAKYCAREHSCKLVNACRTHEMAVYESLKTTSREEMESRKKQYTVAQRTKCLIQHMNSLRDNSTQDSLPDAEDCDLVASEDRLDLDFHDPEDQELCLIRAAHVELDAELSRCDEFEMPEAWDAGEASAVTHQASGEAAASGEAEAPRGPAFIFGMSNELECPTGYGTITDMSLCREAVAYAEALDSNPAWMFPTLTARPPTSHARAFEVINGHRETPCGCQLYHYGFHRIGPALNRYGDRVQRTEDGFIPFMNTNTDCAVQPQGYVTGHQFDYMAVCQCQEASCQPPVQVHYRYFIEKGNGRLTWECPHGSSPVTEAECRRDAPAAIETAEGFKLRFPPEGVAPPGCSTWDRSGEYIWNDGTTPNYALYGLVCKELAEPEQNPGSP